MSDSFREDLRGLTMVVTGAGRGIGKELAQSAALAGMRVALLEIDQANLDQSVSEIKALGGDVTGYRVDLGVEDDVIATLAKVEKDFGQVDCLVNNAMVHEVEDLLSTTLENWNHSLRITLTASFLCIRALLPGMIARGAGNIINIGSVNAKVMLGSDSYSVAKAGMHAITRSVAVRYGGDGIRCNTVVPGTIATSAWQERVDNNPQVFENLKPWYPLGRIGKPRDIVEAVLFLASSRSEWMSGSELVVDGGLLAAPAPMFRIIEGPQ